MYRSAYVPWSPPVKIQCRVPPVQGRLSLPLPFQLVWWLAVVSDWV
jgi:hypothetical protein